MKYSDFRCTVLCLFFLNACSTTQHVAATPTLVTLCKINQSQEAYIGKALRVKAVFESDGRHHAYFIDEGCGEEGKLIDAGRIVGNEDYDALDKKWKRECDAKGEANLCVVSKKVVVIGSVRKTDSGLFFDVSEIEEAD